MSSLGYNPTTFLRLISGNIYGGPAEITITKEELHSDFKSFSKFIINENKAEKYTKNTISGVIKFFNISNDIEINALKYSYEETSSFLEEMNSRMSKDTFKATLQKDEYYVVSAEMKLYVFNVKNSVGQTERQRLIVPTGRHFQQVVNKEGVANVILDESWEILILNWNAKLKFYKHDELECNIPSDRIKNLDLAAISDVTANVISEGSTDLNKETQLSGINITNDLNQGVLTDIEIYSVISNKVAGSVSYAFDWRYVDVELNQMDGRWLSRQRVKASSRIPPRGGHEQFQCSLRFDEVYRHYWQFKCKIDGKRYRINKNNAMVNVWNIDNNKIPRFTLMDEGDYKRINMVFNSGAAYFYLEQY